MHRFSKLLGATLLEILLILTIMGAIFYLGMRMYASLRVQSDTYALQRNVDMIMAAAARYYYANCSNGGALDPRIFNPGTETSSYVPVTLQTLVSGGFLLDENNNIQTAIPLNPLVNSTAGNTQNGYVLEYEVFYNGKQVTVG